ncbi:MAG: ribonuclease E [Candidatus Xenolissoclinum pacificiensis L6]|uniref:Ribonuclease G n=1 Tax=Candidatus Xenolissoclinum pacificiensis L6 TaxID=1401685 RepID=W2V0A6_9RICK|nr:MAG: ribonuclease E [Candidatus Xenolissoclinum pacificiensis L6]
MGFSVLVDARHIADEIRIAVINNTGILTRFEQETSLRKLQKGNIYYGRVYRIEPALQAVFIEYGIGKYGFLPFSDIDNSLLSAKSHEQETKKESAGEVESLLSEGQWLFVQVVKEARGNKGVTLTTYLRLQGIYCIFIPIKNPKDRDLVLMDRDKNEKEKKRLRGLIYDMKKRSKTSNICIMLKENSINVPNEEIIQDFKNIKSIWRSIKSSIQKNGSNQSPHCVFFEGDLIKRFISNMSFDNVSNVIVDLGNTSNKTCNLNMISDMLPKLNDIKVRAHRSRHPIFTYYNIEEQIMGLYQSSVRLPSGGSLVITPTEALISIDVNSGSMTDKSTVEETAYKTNMEAVKESVRQIELRNASGLIVIDFIDMSFEKYCDDIYKSIIEEFKSNNTKVQVTPLSVFGMMEISRQRTGSSIYELNTTECKCCNGNGRVMSTEYISIRIIRALYDYKMTSLQNPHIVIRTDHTTALYLLNERRKKIFQIENNMSVRIQVMPDDSIPYGSFNIYHKEAKHDLEDNCLTTKDSEIVILPVKRSWISRIISKLG